MAQEIASHEPATGRFLLDIIPLAAAATTEEELVNSFTRALSAVYGIDRVTLTDVKRDNESQQGALLGYINNTKKPYIDNQLSEYSAFPELIDYKNRGFKSCAVLPLVGEGRVFSLLELLSTKESKFSEPVLKEITFGTSFLSFVLLYKSELGRSVRLATYFDAAFNSQFPQLIVAEDGSIVKFNKASMRHFNVTAPEPRKVQEILKLDFQKLAELAKTQPANIIISSRGATGKVYAISAGKINDKLLHVSGNEITDQYTYSSIVGALARSYDLCMVFADSNFTIVDITPNAERMFGYSNGVMLNGNLVELATRPEQNDFRRFLESAAGDSAVHSSITFEFGGSRKYLRYIARRFLNGYMVMFFNADFEKQAEDLRSDLEDFTSGSTDIVLKADSLGYIRDCNLPAETVLGFRKEEIVGKDLKSIYADQQVLDRDINYVKGGGKVDNSFINLIKKDSTLVPATHSMRLIKSKENDPSSAYLIIIKELGTKFRLSDLESRIRRYEGMLSKMEQSSQLKSQFIYNISHELKTPLTNIKGYTRLLYDGEFGQLTEEQKEYIKTTLSEADRLLLIIQQILDAAKLEAEKVKLDLKEVDLMSLQNNPSIKALEDAAKNKGLAFEWSVNWDVPQKITADPNRLIQVFVNLIGNAIKFTDEGSIKVRIAKKGKNIECSVADTGIGISEADRNRMFRKKFYEVTKKDKATELIQQPGAGTGLGLSIVNDIVKLHGGKRGVESKPGEGSRFWFTIPISRKQKRKSADKAAAVPAQAPAPAAQSQ